MVDNQQIYLPPEIFKNTQICSILDPDTCYMIYEKYIGNVFYDKIKIKILKTQFKNRLINFCLSKSNNPTNDWRETCRTQPYSVLKISDRQSSKLIFDASKILNNDDFKEEFWKKMLLHLIQLLIDIKKHVGLIRFYTTVRYYVTHDTVLQFTKAQLERESTKAEDSPNKTTTIMENGKRIVLHKKHIDLLKEELREKKLIIDLSITSIKTMVTKVKPSLMVNGVKTSVTSHNFIELLSNIKQSLS